MAGHRRAVFALLERAGIGAEHFGQHRHHAVGEIDRIAALARLLVDLAARADIEADIGDRDHGTETVLPVGLRPDRIVMVAGVGRVDGDDRQRAQVFAVFLAQWKFCGAFGLVEHLFGEGVRDAVFVDRDQAEGLGRKRIAQHLDDFHARARRAAQRFGQHHLPCLRAAEVADLGRIAHPLVDGREPGLPAAIQFHHAEHRFMRGGQLLHRMGDPAGAGLLGARQHPVALLQRRGPARAFLALDQANARRRGRIVGLPAVGNGERLAVLDLDHAQHRHLGHAAHAVIGALLAVDQAFIGHVLEQALERDLLLPLEAEGARDLPLARGRVGSLDEFEHLLLAGQAVRFWIAGHVRAIWARR